MTEQPADKGSTASMTESEERHRELRDIFVTVTGSEEFTEVQEEHSSLRSVVPEESISGSVTEVAKADGLSDTFSDLEYTIGGG